MSDTSFFNEETDANQNITDEFLSEHYAKSPHPKEFLIQLENEYRLWLAEQKKRLKLYISPDQLRESLLLDLSVVSKMDAREYTLYLKWREIQNDKYALSSKQLLENTEFISAYKSDSVFRADIDWYLQGFPDKSFKASKLLSQYRTLNDAAWGIWQPLLLDEFALENLEPEVIPCISNKELTQFWNIIRTYSHSMVNNNNIGRNMYFIVRNKFTENPGEGNKVLGAFALSSDFMDLTPRDEYIGWSRETRSNKKMINHTAIASTIMPTQPFGFNYNGGKLIALLAISDVVENIWNEKYNKDGQSNRLIGITTTSLYGNGSMYNSLKYWKSLGETKGTVKYEPSEETYKLIKQYLIQEAPRKYWQWFVAKRPGGLPLKRENKQRALAYSYQLLNIGRELTETNHRRGVYFCPLFENFNEFLQMKISEDKLIRRMDFNNNVESLTALWKDKYAYKRIDKLSAENKIIYPKLFYSDLIHLSWEQAREKYLALAA